MYRARGRPRRLSVHAPGQRIRILASRRHAMPSCSNHIARIAASVLFTHLRCRGGRNRAASMQRAFQAAATRWGSAELCDAVVIGAGVVGLAIARELALADRKVLVLERGTDIGVGTSGRNSEVIHAGLYYRPGSLKARLCVEGKHMLYGYLAERGLPHMRLGKVLVASGASQLAKLEDVRRCAERNGVTDLVPLTRADVVSMEPELRCDAAVLSPSTGVLSVRALMESFRRDAEERGMTVALGARVTGGDVTGAGGIRVDVEEGTTKTTLRCKTVVNAAGLHARDVSCALGVEPSRLPPRWMAKGAYFALPTGRRPFSRLVHPMPEDGGLGIHYTVDVRGGARFGPSVEWLPAGTEPDALSYAVDPSHVDRFRHAVRGYFPGVESEDLLPEFSGARPKVAGPGEGFVDFCIHGPEDHGGASLVCLYGIESPGLTSCMALASHVVQKLTR